MGEHLADVLLKASHTWQRGDVVNHVSGWQGEITNLSANGHTAFVGRWLGLDELTFAYNADAVCPPNFGRKTPAATPHEPATDTPSVGTTDDTERAQAFLIWMEGEEPFFCPGDLRPYCAQLQPSVVARLSALLADVRCDERRVCVAQVSEEAGRLLTATDSSGVAPDDDDRIVATLLAHAAYAIEVGASTTRLRAALVELLADVRRETIEECAKAIEADGVRVEREGATLGESCKYAICAITVRALATDKRSVAK